jgi:DNA replicative helicase MCM subunit Mcm2 (Cdc46/Mcm family)
MRLCMDRISPACRDAYIRMSLPPMRTAQDIDKAAEKVTQAIRRGAVTPADGETMMNIFEMRSRIIETAQLENRIEKLEQDKAAADGRRDAEGVD